MHLLFWEVCSINSPVLISDANWKGLTNKTFLFQFPMPISCLFLQRIHPPPSSSYAHLWSGNTGTSKQGPRGGGVQFYTHPRTFLPALIHQWSQFSDIAFKYTRTVMCHIVERSHIATNATHNYSYYSTQKYFW